MAVPFEELSNSPRQSVTQDGWTGTREFKIAWSNIDAFIVELLGQTRRVQSGVQNITPSGFPSRPLATCTQVNVEPFVASPAGAEVTISGAANTFPFAKVTASYTLKPRAYNAPEGTYLTWDQSHETEAMMTPGRNWRFDGVSGDDNDEDARVGEDQPFPILIAVTNHTLRWERVALPPWSAIQACRGAVNSGVYLGAIPGSLLFKGAKTTTTFDLVGQVRYNLEYTFVEKTVLSTVSASITNAAGSPIVFTCDNDFDPGEYVQVTGVLGNDAANGIFRVASATSSSFTAGSSGSSNPYGGGGIARKIYGQWNYLWREKPDANGEHWFRIVDADNETTTPYQSVDFDALFRYGSRLGGDLTVEG